MFDTSFEYNRKDSGDNTGTATNTDERRKQKIIDSLNGVIQPKSLKKTISSQVKTSKDSKGKKNKSEGYNSLEFDHSYD